MELEQTHIDHIRFAFQAMQNKKDLLSLMNYVKPLIYGVKSVPFELKQLTYYANPNNGKTRYNEFKIKKKSGGERSIHAPVRGLKAIQKCLALIMQCVFEPHKAAMGFVKDKSIVDNAKIHVGNHYVYNIDLKDFFQSIDQARVWKCLQLEPFYLINNNETEVVELIGKAGAIQLNLHNHMKEGSINDLIIRLHYVGFIYAGGSYNIKLKDGGNISYKIEKTSILENLAIVTVFKRFSHYKIVIDLAKQHSEDKNLDFDSVLPIFIGQLIDNHQRKINQSNTRVKLANLITTICCTQMQVERKNSEGVWEETKKNVLPQGAPTSPVLTNVVCQRLDYLLTAVAKRFGLKYSRYADDMTFSSLHNVFQKNSPFLKEMKRVIIDQGFTIKESKTRLQVDGIRKSVTGLVVNEKVNVQKRYVKQLRMWLNLWERYGYTKAEDIFKRDYFMDKGHVKKGKPNLANVTDGKLNYLKMVKGADDSTYIKLKERFDTLAQESSQLETILKEWEQNGIERAMEIYKV